MGDSWNADDYVLKLLELVPDGEHRTALAFHRDRIAELFQQAFADGVEVGTVVERLTPPLA